jgi:uncharacterized protein (DUF58 family)
MWPRRSRAEPPAPAPAAAPRPAPGQRAGAERLLRRLEWTVMRRLDGRLQGDYRTLFRGTGIDLADLREYQHHDDARHIDWNVTARLDVAHVREFTESREIGAWFLVDLSASVDFGSGEQSKRSVARDVVATMAQLLTRQGNRIGALTYRNRVDAVLPSRAGRQQVLALMHRLDLTANDPAPTAATDLGALFERAAQLIRRRSLVFVVSDFQSLPGWESALGRLALRNEVVAIRVVDPLERELPDLGLAPIEDAETGEQLIVDTSDPGFRRRFAQAVERRDAELETAFARAGVDALEVATDDDLAEAVSRFAQLRKLRQRTARGAS